jgi:hypothetical protein
MAFGSYMDFWFRYGFFQMRIFQWLRSKRPVVTDWQDYHVQPFENVRLKDGSEAKLNDHVMRRRLADGLWEYRWPTEQEANDQWKADQW